MTLAALIKLVGPTLAHALFAIIFKGSLKDALAPSDLAGTLAATLDMGGLVERITDGEVPRYKSEYIFRRNGDKTTEMLMAVFQQEGIEMSEGDREEAVAAAIATIDRRALPLLLKRNLSGYAFRQELRREKSATPLSEAQTALYERILDRSASLVYAVADELPNFTRDSTARLLENEATLLARMEQALETQQKILNQTYGEQQANQSQIFEQEYRRSLAYELDNLELFGIDRFKGARQPLTVAYIKLQAAMNHYTLDVEEALGKANRLLVVGPAGSGKTTLLKWVTVQVARYKLDGSLAHWSDRMPFYLRLRDYANQALPSLEKLFTALSRLKFLTDTKPDYWSVTQFREGKGLLFIDGMDEVSEEKRQEALAWLDQLLRLHEQTIVVVSSRPSGLGSQAVNQTLSQMAFQRFELQPLQENQIEEFVRQWHEAMVHPDCKYVEKSIVPAKETDLLQVFKGRQDLRRLAQTPLLCSMICALHLLELRELPQDRIRLYSRCINILLSRDADRSIQDDSPVELHLETVYHLLAVIAYWMLEHNPALIKREDVMRLLENQYDEETAAHLLKILAERSVIFRQQAEDEFDFIHRTFLEFIAGKEIVRNHQVKRVVRNYGLDSEWHETIRLLAAHTRDEDQASLLDELLELARREPKKKRTLHLLAWDYWALLNVPTSEANGILGKHIDSLNIYGATGLDLSGTQVSDVSVLAGLIHLQQLDLSFTQVNDISRLVGLTHLQHLDLMNTQVSDLSGLAGLTHLQQLDLSRTQVSDVSGLAELIHLQHLSLSMTQVSDVSGLAGLTHLQHLNLNFTQVGDLSGLAGLTHLQHLYLSHTQVSDVSGLAELIHLQHLYLSRTQVSDVSGLAGLTHLQQLDLRSTQVSDISGLAGLTHLKIRLEPNQLSSLEGIDQVKGLDLGFTQVSDLSELAGLTHLQHLDLSMTQVSDLSGLAGLTHLRHLTLSETQVSDVSGLAGLTYLQHLDLSHMQVSDLSGLAGLNNLQHLDLSYTEMSDVSVLAGLNNLQHLDLSYTEMSDVSVLAGLTQLQHLDLSRTQVSDVSVLAGLTHLQHLDLRSTQVSDLSPLADLTQLQELRLVNTAVTDLSPVKHIKGLKIIS